MVTWRIFPFGSILHGPKKPGQARSNITEAFDELNLAAEQRCAELLEQLQEQSAWDHQYYIIL